MQIISRFHSHFALSFTLSSLSMWTFLHFSVKNVTVKNCSLKLKSLESSIQRTTRSHTQKMPLIQCIKDRISFEKVIKNFICISFRFICFFSHTFFPRTWTMHTKFLSSFSLISYPKLFCTKFLFKLKPMKSQKTVQQSTNRKRKLL